MKFRFSPQFPRMVQQVLFIGLVLALVIGGTNLRTIALATRELFVGAVALALVLICSRWLRDAKLLLSPLDFGWVAFIGLTGLAVALAPFPRRSLEWWALTPALQFPLAYLCLYLFRRRWPERAIFRALLVVGGILYAFAGLLTVAYLSQALSAQANGLPEQPFRLWAVLDNPSVFAMFIAVSLPCLVGYAFMKMGRLERVAIILWVIGAGFGTVVNGTRSGAIAALIGMIVALVLALLAHPSQPLRHWQAWAGTHRIGARLLALGTGIIVIGSLAGIWIVQTNAGSHGDGSDRLNLYRIALTSFQKYPISGLGPGGFVMAEELANSSPPFMLVPHAHNILLEYLAETGLIGGIGLLLLLAVAARLCWVSWRTQPERRPLLAGAIGGLIGFLASGLFETPTVQPGLFFIATALLMLVAAGQPAPVRAPWWRVNLIVVPIVAILLLSILLLIPYSQFWQLIYVNDLMGADNPSAVRSGAQQLDTLGTQNPGDPLIALQSGYLWAHLAHLDSDPGQARSDLKGAIERLEQAIKLDPNFGLHYLNMSVLYSKAGRNADALTAAKRAVELSFGDPAAWLNQGLLLEASGDSEAAQAAYLKTITLQPSWKQAGFWQTSSVRQAALASYQPTLDEKYIDFIAAGNSARNANHITDAVKDYHDALASTQDPLYQAVATGLIALTQGDTTAAQSQWQRAAAIAGDTPGSIDAWAYMGDLAASQGNREATDDAYNRVYRFLTSRGIEGLDTARFVAYSVNSFWRFGLVSDYLPDVVMLDVSAENGQRLDVLAKDVSADQRDFAVQIYNSVLQANPADAAAKMGLQQLGAATP